MKKIKLRLMINRKHVWLPKKFVESSNVTLFFRKSTRWTFFFLKMIQTLIRKAFWTMRTSI